MIRQISKLIFVIFVLTINFAAAQDQKMADLGNFRLENGETIRNCRLGYRTFGSMNADRSNIVIYLLWAGGNTSHPRLKPTDAGKIVDTNKYFVVAIDPLSNGVSSSPSNSRLQPRMKFPRYTMRDLVNAEHLLLTKILKIDHALAITGVSMGGMQTFQWMVSYPDFLDKSIPVVGSPQLAPFDLLSWQTQIDEIMNNSEWKHGNYKKNPARGFEYEIGGLILTTPDEVNRRLTREEILEDIRKAKSGSAGLDANDKIRQVQAMMSIDVTEKFGGSWEQTAAAVRAKPMIIVSKFDHTVTAGPALKFARLLKADTLMFEGDCGHSIHLCQTPNILLLIDNFLSR